MRWSWVSITEIESDGHEPEALMLYPLAWQYMSTKPPHLFPYTERIILPQLRQPDTRYPVPHSYPLANPNCAN